MDFLNNGIVPTELRNLTSQLASIENTSELLWIHGYLSGLIQQRQNHVSPKNTHENGHDILVEEAVITSNKVTVLYGTQSGNSKKLASQLVEKASVHGLQFKLVDMGEYDPRELKNENSVFIIVSTQGEGEPPLAAEGLLEYLQSKKATRLEHLRYAVLALGDKGYVNFCKTGADFDKQLELLGAKKIHERIDCDVEYKQDAEKWMEAILEKSKMQGPAIKLKKTNGHTVSKSDFFTRENPGKLLITEAVNLNGRGSKKNTIHLELSSQGQELTYKPGDSLGIYFENPVSLVEEILNFLKIPKDEIVQWQQNQINIFDLLLKKMELIQLNRDLIENFAKLSNSLELVDLLKDIPSLTKFLYGRDLLDLFHEYPIQVSAQELANMLRPMQPRLYSIASSPLYVPGEVHIAVDVLKYEFRDRDKSGACSSYLASMLEAGNYVSAFISGNESFRLPEEHKDIIMIGPGTGVAPFRSFIQHREAQGAKGRNWLFFGSQHFTTDFIYQTEWQKYKKDKVLNKLDLAFSRDQQEKIYVQHRMKQRAKELYSWLENGAHIYVCGDKSKMAKDVHAELIEIIQNEGGMSQEKANEYVKNLRKQKRYLEDVY